MLNEGSRLQNRRRVPSAVPRPARRAKASVRVPSAAHLAWVMLLPEPASSDTASWRGESHVQVHLRCQPDRKSVVKGQSVSVCVDPGGRRLLTKKNKQTTSN